MKKINFLVGLTLFSFLILSPAKAAIFNTTQVGNFDNNLNAAATSTNYYNTGTQLEDIISTIIRVILSLLGTVFLILIFVAGNNWMMAAGNEEKIKKSKETIRDLLVGLCLVLIAYAFSTGLGTILTKVLIAK